MSDNEASFARSNGSNSASQHFLLLSEYTEKLRATCAYYERVRLTALLALIGAIVLLLYIFASSVNSFMALSDYSNSNLILTAQEYLKFLLTQSNSRLAILSIVILYAIAFWIVARKLLSSADRRVKDSAYLLSRLLARASQKYDQELKGDEEDDLEMEIRLVEAENALKLSESLIFSNVPAIATAFATAASLGAVLSFLLGRL